MASNEIKVRLAMRTDTLANWNSNNPVPLKGEICVVEDTNPTLFKIGNGADAFDALPYANDAKNASHYTGDVLEGEDDATAIARILGENTPVQDDIIILKKTISGTKKQYASYIYTGEKWEAMDQNYDAANLYFDSNILATVPFGKYTVPSSGSYEIDAAGKSLKQILIAALADEKTGTVTQPSVSVSLPQAKSYEVGSAVTLQFSVTFNAGKYPYDSSTGVAVESYSVSDTEGNTATTQSGSFSAITVGDSTNYKITATVKHGAGSIPHTNIGNENAAGQIQEGSKTATSGSITGYRSFFYGLDDTDGEINSALIRSLTNGGAYNGKKSLTLKAADKPGVKRFIIAYPANSSRSGISSVLLSSTMNLEITSNYIQQANVDVEGVNGYDAIPYKIFVYSPAEIGADEVHAITLA